jgi:hypothetical protein
MSDAVSSVLGSQQTVRDWGADSYAELPKSSFPSFAFVDHLRLPASTLAELQVHAGQTPAPVLSINSTCTRPQCYERRAEPIFADQRPLSAVAQHELLPLEIGQYFRVAVFDSQGS